jgi:HEAT repeat protein
VAFGTRAIPQIETALHSASPAARLRLVSVLVAMNDPEVIPILRHFARRDTSPEVRAACEAALPR